MIFIGSSLLLANNMQWNLLKISLENFRKTVYGFEEVCFAEVLYGKMTKFFTSDFSMNFFYSISWRNGAITIHFKGFWRTSANFSNFHKLPQNRSTENSFNCEKIALILLKKFLHIVSEVRTWVGKARDGNLGDGTY